MAKQPDTKKFLLNHARQRKKFRFLPEFVSDSKISCQTKKNRSRHGKIAKFFIRKSRRMKENFTAIDKFCRNHISFRKIVLGSIQFIIICVRIFGSNKTLYKQKNLTGQKNQTRIRKLKFFSELRHTKKSRAESKKLLETQKYIAGDRKALLSPELKSSKTFCQKIRNTPICSTNSEKSR